MDTAKCRVCEKVFTLDETFIQICDSCCNHLTSEEEDDLYENSEVSCDSVFEIQPY